MVGLRTPVRLQSFAGLLICHAARHHGRGVSGRDLGWHQVPICLNAPSGQGPDLFHDHDLEYRSLLVSDFEVARNRDPVRLRRNLDLDCGPSHLDLHGQHILPELENHRSWGDPQLWNCEWRLPHWSLFWCGLEKLIDLCQYNPSHLVEQSLLGHLEGSHDLFFASPVVLPLAYLDLSAVWCLFHGRGILAYHQTSLGSHLAHVAVHRTVL